MSSPMSDVTIADAKLTPNVSVYAARARGVHTAAQNALGPSCAALNTHAPNGINRSTPKYTSVIPSVRRKPGSLRFIRLLLFKDLVEHGAVVEESIHREIPISSDLIDSIEF